MPSHLAVLLEAADRRPEIKPLTDGLILTADPGLAGPFQIRGTAIASGGDSVAAQALALRLATETVRWLDRMPKPPTLAQRLVAALLAARAAAVALAMMTEAERTACAGLLPTDALELLGHDQPPGPTPALTGLIGTLLACQGEPLAVSASDLATTLASDVLRQSWRVAVPTESLLTTGGDERLLLVPATGLNRYGCSPRPRPWAFTFASTTATSISDGAFARVEDLRQRLMTAAAAGRLDDVYGDAMAEARGAILAQCGAIAGTEAILAPSGTDGEFYALHLALAADDRPLTNIVIAPQETASNVLAAAAGRHYNPTTAMGRHVAVGEPVDPASTARVELVSLAVRDPWGEPLPAAVIDAAAVQAVETAVVAGRRVLLHLLDTSKTGLVAPAIATTCELARRFAGCLDVVVDASQLRLSRHCLARYLECGFMVIVTGSKFFTGPPFAGALLVPTPIGARIQLGHSALPQGYDAYSERHCWPQSWEHYCHPMGGEANLGLLMRWWAALWEMEAFHAMPTVEARRILADFLGAVRPMIAASPVLRLLPAPPPDRTALGGGESWDGLATILTFALVPEPDKAPLDLATTRRVYGWLNADVVHMLPAGADATDRRLAGLCAHIGQPVLVGASERDGLCGLRLAAGARLVSGAGQAVRAGRTITAFLDAEIAEAALIIAKLEMLLRHLGHLRRISP